MDSLKRLVLFLLVGLWAAGGLVCVLEARQQAPHRLLINQYCTNCHNDSLKTAIRSAKKDAIPETYIKRASR